MKTSKISKTKQSTPKKVARQSNATKKIDAIIAGIVIKGKTTAKKSSVETLLKMRYGSSWKEIGN